MLSWPMAKPQDLILKVHDRWGHVCFVAAAFSLSVHKEMASQ